MPADPTYLGDVQDVQGATVSIALDQSTVSGLAFVDGHGYRIGQIGSFVRISIGFHDLYGLVSQIGAGAVPESVAEHTPHGFRWLKVQLVGEVLQSGEFQRGVSQYPTIGDRAHLVSERDLKRIYGSSDNPNFVRIGRIASAESIPALLNVNRLITRHSAVVGNTGAGKTTAVVNLLLSLSDPDNYPSARVLIFDIHGEYFPALKDRATVFRVDADENQGERPLFVPYWGLSFDELMRVTPFHGVSETDRVALLDKVIQLKSESLRKMPRDGVSLHGMTVDTPVPFSIHRFWYELYRAVCSTHVAQRNEQSDETEAIVTREDGTRDLGDIMQAVPPRYQPITQRSPDPVFLSASPLNIRRQLLAMQSRLRDPQYDFLLRPGQWCPEPTLDCPDAQPEEDLDTLIQSWVGGDKPITILDLSGVPMSILEDLIGALLRILTDSMFWSRYRPEGGRARPLLIVLEEAHAYLDTAGTRESARAARRILKEGRKYGLGAMIVSQRPSEIDPTILSQCGSIFSMRLANATDRSHVTGVVSDHLDGFFDMLPSLRTGEAIVVGESADLPLRVMVDDPSDDRRPESGDPLINDPSDRSGWKSPKREEDYSAVLRAWRSRDPKIDDFQVSESEEK